MPLASITYKFTQKFKVPVDEAFAWSIDYDPEDLKLLYAHGGKRRVTKLTEDAIILDDTVDKGRGPVTTRRLVRVNHERRSFASTHIGGPTPHSQFWYEFFPEKGGGSRLVFTGLFLLPTAKKLSAAELAKMTEEERKADIKTWKSLAKAMEADLRG